MSNAKRYDTIDEYILSVLGYLGFLFVLPLLVKPKSSYCKFHALQSVFMFFLAVLVLVILAIVPLLGSLLTLAIIVLYIIVIISALMGKLWKVPLIGFLVNKLMSNKVTSALTHNELTNEYSKTPGGISCSRCGNTQEEKYKYCQKCMHEIYAQNK